MHLLIEFFNNDVLTCSLLSWFIAQTLKVPTMYLTTKKFSLKRFWGSGGMPSSHTAMVVALNLMVGIKRGFDSPEFAIALVLDLIVMYDAAGVRRQTGTQATIINEIVRKIFIEGEAITEKDLKELVGHTPLEVLGGAIVGILTTIIYSSLI